MNTSDLIIQANKATASLATLTDSAINTVLTDTAAALRLHSAAILEANRLDLERMEPSNPKYDRLLLTEERIHAILAELDSGRYGAVLRAKGIVKSGDGKWIHFDYVPEEHEVRFGGADYTGRLCVIGSKIDEDALKALFEV